MMLRKTSLAMAAIATTLAAATISDRAAAAIVSDTGYRFAGPSGGFYWLDGATVQSRKSLSGTTSRSFSPNMRRTPSMGGRGMMRGMGGGRMNGGMRRR
jgi:hypothetical protein